MTENEQKFFTYWKTNMFRKVTAPTDKVLEAYSILYGRSYPGCKSCNLSPVAQQLKDVFHKFLKEEEEQLKQQELINLEVEKELLNSMDNEEFMRQVMEEEKKQLEKQQVKKHPGGRPPKKK